MPKLYSMFMNNQIAKWEFKLKHRFDMQFFTFSFSFTLKLISDMQSVIMVHCCNNKVDIFRGQSFGRESTSPWLTDAILASNSSFTILTLVHQGVRVDLRLGSLQIPLYTKTFKYFLWNLSCSWSAFRSILGRLAKDFKGLSMVNASLAIFS